MFLRELMVSRAVSLVVLAALVVSLFPLGFVAAEELPPEEPVAVLGCMDETALNYNPSATVDDGSCEFEPEVPAEPIVEPIVCLDDAALNYEAEEECVYEEEVVEEEVIEDEEELPSCLYDENLVVNGSFEEEVADESAYEDGFYEIFPTITGWTTDSEDGIEIWNNMFGGAAHGDQNVELDVSEPTTISQTIATVPGNEYKLTFAFSARPGTDSDDNAFTLLVNGEEEWSDSADGSDLEATDWGYYEFLFDAESEETTISFRDDGTANGLGTLLDDVSLCTTYEYEEEEELFPVVGFKWNDVNGNGEWDEAEVGLPN